MRRLLRCSSFIAAAALLSRTSVSALSNIIGFQFFPKERVSSSSLSASRRRRRSWEESYELLLSYKEEHGHTNVPQSDKPLGTWVNSQRNEHTKYLRLIEHDSKNEKSKLPKTSMTSRRKELLDDVGFVWDAVGNTWMTRYKELCEFRREHGHCVVPRSSGRLGAWVEKMRIEYKKYNMLLTEEGSKHIKLKTILTQDRVHRLDEIDFVWNVREKQFEQNLGELRIFAAMNGHIDPRFMNGKLALWVRRMEREYRHYLQATSEEEKSTVMSAQRVMALESVGFSDRMFDEPRSRSMIKPRATWEERYEELKEYKQVNGDCVVPKNYGPLGSWVRSQRHLRKEQGTGASFEGGGQLSQDRVNRLNNLGFVWDVHQYQWNQTYHELLAYRKKHGDCNVPMSYGGLGLWVFNQRAYYKSYCQGQSSHMTESRLQMLEDIGFAFDLGQRISSAADERWRDRLVELKEYLEDWGTLNVKQSRNPSLYNWCQRQKACHRAKLEGKKSPLTNEREDALRSIGFIE